MVSRSERVLITGGSGFTGRRLAERLREDGHRVFSLDRHSQGDDNLNVDLGDYDAVANLLTLTQPTAVVHLAGIAAPTHSKIDQMYAANVIGTANLLAASGAGQIAPRIIIASSSHVYSPAEMGVPLKEEDTLAPKTHYAVSKHAAEEIARIYWRQFPIIICRPFNYTGPGQRDEFLVPKIVRHFVERRSEIRIGNLDLFRDLSDVRRVVEAYSRLVSNPIDSTIVNICSGRAVHLAGILEMMSKISGHHIKVVTDPTLIRKDEPRFLVGSPSRLESLVGPLPNPEFYETLEDMFEASCHNSRAGGTQ